MPDIFLSYNREDQAVARRFADAFKAQGFDVWWDTTLQAGDAYDKVTEQALSDAKAVVVLWSPRSVDSRWVRAEATQADRNGTLIPVMIEPCKRPIMFELTQTAELNHWKGDPKDAAWQAFLSDVRKFVQKDAASSAPQARTTSNETAALAPPLRIGLPAWIGRRRILSIALPVVLLIVATAYLGNYSRKAVDVTPVMAVAVLRFDAPAGDIEMERFAQAISLTIAGELTKSGFAVIAPSKSIELTGARKAEAAELLGARLLVDGNVTREGTGARIGIHLDHAKRGFTVWSSALESELGKPTAVGSRLAAQLETKLGMIGPVTLLNSNEPDAVDKARAWLLIIQRSDEGDDIGAVEAAKKFVAIWPNQSQPNFMQTIETMDALHMLSPRERIKEFEEASAAARRAMQFDDRESAGAEVAIARTTPIHAWGKRIAAFERIISEGRAVPPVAYLAMDYLNVGRSSASHELTKPSSRSKSRLIVRAQTLLAMGQREEADRELDDGIVTWPLHPLFPQLRFESAMWMGSADEAQLRLLKSGTWLPTEMERGLLSQIIDARRTRDVRRISNIASVCHSQAAMRDEAVLIYCVSALTVLDRLDDAFKLADQLFPDIRPRDGEDPNERWIAAPAASWSPTLLYMPWTAPLRADPRIIPVFERLGLLDYWRASGQWPDFCQTEPKSVCSKMKAR